MNDLLGELFHVGIYKRSQGRITRQVTLAAMAVALALGFWRLSTELQTSALAESAAAWFGAHALLLPFFWIAKVCAWIAATPEFYLWFPTVLLAATLWASYRLINVPRVADFLIAVEAEMNKVSWPTGGELFRASVVVLVTIFALAVVLFGFDFVWNWFFRDVLKIL